MPHRKNNNAIRMVCAPDGAIAEIISDSGDFFQNAQTPPKLDAVLTPSAKKRYLAFLDEVSAEGYGLCDSIMMENGFHSMPFSLFGVKKDAAFHLIALQTPEHLFHLFEDFMRMLNEQGVLLREAQKQGAAAPLRIEEEKKRLLEECMAINNDLANMQRELAKKHEQLKNAYATIEEISVKDPLTGIANRRKVVDALLEEIARCERYGAPLTILSLDIDHFKRINDTYGHAAGDDALTAFAKTCQTQLRNTDLLGRIGGEEFLALLIHTSGRQAEKTAQRIRASIEGLAIEYDDAVICFTVSVGLAEHRQGEDMNTLLRRADAALYLAKNQGRNRVVMAPDSE